MGYSYSPEESGCDLCHRSTCECWTKLTVIGSEARKTRRDRHCEHCAGKISAGTVRVRVRVKHEDGHMWSADLHSFCANEFPRPLRDPSDDYDGYDGRDDYEPSDRDYDRMADRYERNIYGP